MAVRATRTVVTLMAFALFLALTSPSAGGQAWAEKARLSVDVCPTKCQFRLGETVSLRVTVSNSGPRTVRGDLALVITRLADEVHAARASVEVQPHSDVVHTFSWTPPQEAAGYGVEVEFHAGTDCGLVRASTAFDVAKAWTRAPRYGFMCDFPPRGLGAKIGANGVAGTGDEPTDLTCSAPAAGVTEAARAADGTTQADHMNRYHINAVQFYDWMYRHDTLLPDCEEFVDSLGRRLSIRMVADKIRAVKDFGMAAMAYVTVYAASREFFERHPEWALWQGVGIPYTLGNGYLYLMNPAQGSPWRERMMSEYQKAVTDMGFDGVHIDQYGYPKRAFTTSECDSGAVLRIDRTFTDFVNDAKCAVTQVHPGAFAVFNCVNNWPVESIAPSDADIVYIEVWPPHDTYSDIVDLVSEARRLSFGKAVVLAAYLSPSLEASVRYLDAVIFSAGGSHIEIGEGENMLADPYFPKYEPISHRLGEWLRGCYDFCTRYVDLLYPGVDESDERCPGLEVAALDHPSTSDDSATREIWMIQRRKGSLAVVNIVNLLRVSVPVWRIDQPAPPVLRDVRLQVRLEKPLCEVYFASPEYRGGKMVKLQAEKIGGAGKHTYEFTIPYLEYWSMVVIREEEGRR